MNEDQPLALPDVPQADPLAVLAIAAPSTRRALHGLATAAGAGGVIAGFGAFAVLCSWLLTLSPVLPFGLSYVGEDDRQMMIDGFDIFLISGLSGLVLLLLAWLALAGWVRRIAPRLRASAAAAMRDDYQSRRRPPVQPAKSKWRLLLWTLAWAIVLAAAWLMGAEMFDLDRWPRTALGFAGHTFATIAGLFIVIPVLMLAGTPLYLGWATGKGILARSVRPLGISSSDVADLEIDAYAEDRARALSEHPGPSGPPLHCQSVLAVMAGATVTVNRRGRRLELPWAAEPTTVESLAGSLLAAAAAECEKLGWLDLDDSRKGWTWLKATLPPDRQPTGVAQVVLGRHRVGLAQRPWVARGRWRAVIESWCPGDVDPHWKVIELALNDLRAAGILSADTDGVERVDTALLRAQAAQVTVDPAAPRFADHARQAHRALKALSTTNASTGSMGFSLLYFFTSSRENDQRNGRRLPAARVS